MKTLSKQQIIRINALLIFSIALTVACFSGGSAAREARQLTATATRQFAASHPILDEMAAQGWLLQTGTGHYIELSPGFPVYGVPKYTDQSEIIDFDYKSFGDFDISPDGQLLVGLVAPFITAAEHQDLLANDEWLRSRFVVLDSDLNVVFEDPTKVGTSHINGYHFSPDGKKIAMAEGTDVIVFDVATRTFTTVASNHYDTHIRGYGTPAPQWTPDSTSLVYRSNDHQNLIVNIATGEQTETVAGSLPVFSPDGSKMLYSRDRDDVMSIYVYDVATQTEEKLFDDDFYKGPYLWTPDGKGILFRDQQFVHPNQFYILMHYSFETKTLTDTRVKSPQLSGQVVKGLPTAFERHYMLAQHSNEN